MNRLPWYARFRVGHIPAGRFGDWAIVKCMQEKWSPLLPASESMVLGGRPMPPMWPGIHTILRRLERWQETIHFEGEPCTRQRQEWKTWMADSAPEIYDQIEPIQRMRGTVLIGGLGLGVMVRAALLNRRVKRVVVIEQDADIIRFIGPHYSHRKVQIIHDDFMQFEASAWGRERYDLVWADIWRDVSAKNIPDMLRLRRWWESRCRWYGAWCEEWSLENLRAQADGDERFESIAAPIFEAFGRAYTPPEGRHDSGSFAGRLGPVVSGPDGPVDNLATSLVTNLSGLTDPGSRCNLSAVS